MLSRKILHLLMMINDELISSYVKRPIIEFVFKEQLQWMAHHPFNWHLIFFSHRKFDRIRNWSGADCGREIFQARERYIDFQSSSFKSSQPSEYYCFTPWSNGIANNYILLFVLIYIECICKILLYISFKDIMKNNNNMCLTSNMTS